MRLNLRRTALIYDFDGTLARGNMQERSFIPEIGITRDTFWREVKTMAEQNDADEILVYMHLMVEKSKKEKLKYRRLFSGNMESVLIYSGAWKASHGLTESIFTRSNTG